MHFKMIKIYIKFKIMSVEVVYKIFLKDINLVNMKLVQFYKFFKK